MLPRETTYGGWPASGEIDIMDARGRTYANQISVAYLRGRMQQLIRIVVMLCTASKVKHHLNSFLEKTLKLSKHKIILVTFLKGDKVVTIYSKF